MRILLAFVLCFAALSAKAGPLVGEGNYTAKEGDIYRDGAKVEIPDRTTPGESKGPGKGEGKRRRKEGA